MYDITTQSCSTAELSEARSDISAIAAGNKIFFGGGEISDGTFPTKTVDIYDASTNTWSVAALSQPGKDMGTAIAGNKVFFAGCEGGLAASSRQNRAETVDIYDLTTSTWSVGHLSEPRYQGISAVAANGKVYLQEVSISPPLLKLVLFSQNRRLTMLPTPGRDPVYMKANPDVPVFRDE